MFCYRQKYVTKGSGIAGCNCIQRKKNDTTDFRFQELKALRVVLQNPKGFEGVKIPFLVLNAKIRKKQYCQNHNAPSVRIMRNVMSLCAVDQTYCASVQYTRQSCLARTSPGIAAKGPSVEPRQMISGMQKSCRCR